ncbi:hypothetical protein KPSA1_05353 [Pseudomonas syringae pv. actinidiae]|uniref:Uncharacterized protein n=1 Tax=Pseudomonas syringae pv. actinidiae TaxID=103796 RepID=A0A2V0QNT6_PSESF|nr:hypothetical protein KPSA1_05353 [Pseudomonas syringae pv. actinidiae]
MTTVGEDGITLIILVIERWPARMRLIVLRIESGRDR